MANRGISLNEVVSPKTATSGGNTKTRKAVDRKDYAYILKNMRNNAGHIALGLAGLMAMGLADDTACIVIDTDKAVIQTSDGDTFDLKTGMNKTSRV